MSNGDLSIEDLHILHEILDLKKELTKKESK
ncbi:hypothetical protein HOR75_gp10 [Shewanella phage SppYZU05]|uniref:Uncharacterized protein n=1 Tax=Shewanella phage SppYZU05 TaxID=1970795 RepID=A0A1W6JTF7_9CAUD|nr:hypothetical protein HOR75_gp10 [Shewanella phage SppYZU05]ARM70536.1 hypothetical protein SppYZU05_10 [Shewanella phage SppYZU05]